MQLPQAPPDGTDVLTGLKPEAFFSLFERGIKPEIAGEYLHWDQLRRHPPPEGLTPEQWWYVVSTARSMLQTDLPLADKAGAAFHFSRTDGLQQALHLVDRSLGNWAPSPEALANSDIRDRFVISSLMEEAITSSQLEGASTTRQVAKEMLRDNRAPRTKDERMILNNYRAMEWLRARVQSPLTLAFLLELHRILTEGTLRDEEIGRLRRPDELVIVEDEGDGGTLHVPPPAAELEKRLERLFAFANATESDAFIHPAVRAIVLHFMIGYEHPFVDGNGRTARMLFYWSMLRQGYWMTEFLSISRIIHKAPSQYMRAYLYTETDSGDVTYFLFHQLGVIQQAKKALDEYLARKSRELEELKPFLRDDDGLNHRQRALLAHALRHPGARYTIGPHQREHGVVYQTARQDLLSLEEAGYLRRVGSGRKFSWEAVKDLEARLRRRRSGRKKKS